MSVPHFLKPAIGRRKDFHTLWTVEGNRLVADVLELAADSASRNKGLLGRTGLAPGEALALAPCWAVHTVGMKFPIDIIYAARDGRIVKLCRHVQPWRMSASIRAFATIEMAAGAIDRIGLEPGQRLLVKGRAPA